MLQMHLQKQRAKLRKLSIVHYLFQAMQMATQQVRISDNFALSNSLTPSELITKNMYIKNKYYFNTTYLINFCISLRLIILSDLTFKLFDAGSGSLQAVITWMGIEQCPFQVTMLPGEGH
ncbi:hypothetical protein A3841_10090 [Pontibacter flavimaris]|uniref:Uncharacterized protein n=2 Tax=Pontibacter flavimaris TaxID=1797110 RepID=A0A1Q5PGU3_9BACT|nr:hypothetical protein A3841_10090 [Pontibacter flavimaris]